MRPSDGGGSTWEEMRGCYWHVHIQSARSARVKGHTSHSIGGLHQTTKVSQHIYPACYEEDGALKKPLLVFAEEPYVRPSDLSEEGTKASLGIHTMSLKSSGSHGKCVICH